MPSTAITRRAFRRGMVRRCAQAPAAASSASASRCCRVRRKVDSDGTAPVTPSPASVASSASAAHSAIAVNERAPASAAHTARPTMAGSRWRIPRRHRGSAIPPSTVSRPAPSQADDCARSARWPMAGSVSDDGEGRAWSLASDPAGVATAMITPRAMPALLPPPARPWQATQQPSERTLPTPCHGACPRDDRSATQSENLGGGVSARAETGRLCAPSGRRIWRCA